MRLMPVPPWDFGDLSISTEAISEGVDLGSRRGVGTTVGTEKGPSVKQTCTLEDLQEWDHVAGVNMENEGAVANMGVDNER